MEFLEATECMVFNKEKARASMSTQLSSIKLDTRTMEIYKNVKQCHFSY